MSMAAQEMFKMKEDTMLETCGILEEPGFMMLWNLNTHIFRQIDKKFGYKQYLSLLVYSAATNTNLLKLWLPLPI